MIIKKEFNKSEFYNFRFMDKENIHVIRIPYDDFKIKMVPSYIEIDDNNLIFATIICIMNDGLINFLHKNVNCFSLYEMTNPFSSENYSDKDSFYMFNCDQTDVALISQTEKNNLSNYNSKKYGSIFLVTESKDLYLKVKLFL